MSSGDGNGVEEPPRALLACQACGKAGPPKTCSGCKAVFYCDRDCQIRDRMDHRTMCAGLKKCRLQQEQEIEKAKKLLQDKQEHAVTECAICLEENASSEASFVKLHCGHFFCYVCLYECQVQSLEKLAPGSCPLCRQTLPPLSALLGERNSLFNLLAHNASTKEQRDEICSIASQELETIMQTHPGLLPALYCLGETCT